MSMQLDDYRIAIRERDYLDVLDLSLRVIRAHARPLLGAFVAGVLPFALFNAWLLSDNTEPHMTMGFPAGYMFYMSLLTVWQMSLATAPVTLYLGHALFSERLERKKLTRRYLAALPQMILYQIVARGLLLLPMLTGVVFFWVWPYFGEVILLERNPLRRGRQNRITTMRRVSSLHRGSAGDLFARWMGATSVGMMIITSVWLTLYMLRGFLTNQWAFQGIVFTVFFPLALWIAFGYLTVVRFLSYLDLRIRREGWEVELLMRAESARLSKVVK